MNIADQFQQIRIFLTNDRFITVLEEMTTPLMTSIEGNSVSSHKTAHDFA